MKNIIAMLVLVFLVVGCEKQEARLPELRHSQTNGETNAQGYWRFTNLVDLATGTDIVMTNYQEPFLTISQAFIRFPEGSVLVRVEDKDWQAITNAYAERMVVERMRFYK